ncbi:hypothetical protein P4O66_004310 [Electrophorus voltai]|uniref:Uncharacterized protein n=1 Tax=Electrophorus voltai TaxID=2609070 RepID=A0AAD8ZQL2_9TELE|nr:hypothetical protein P4O66_004310 [Electrophorus voltai]
MSEGSWRGNGAQQSDGVALQIQCYQCEEIRQDDCSSPEFIVNCTVNVQDMCQKEVLVMEDAVPTDLPLTAIAVPLVFPDPPLNAAAPPPDPWNPLPLNAASLDLPVPVLRVEEPTPQVSLPHAKPVPREVARWTDQSVAALQDTLDDADWDMFRRSTEDVSEFTEAVVGFIGKLVDDMIPRATIKKWTKPNARL